MADESSEAIPTVRKTCTIAALTLRRLERLARRGTHGTSAAAIMTNFIEAGIREAIKEGYIQLEDND
jgi:hypothetical protein